MQKADFVAEQDGKVDASSEAETTCQGQPLVESCWPREVPAHGIEEGFLANLQRRHREEYGSSNNDRE